MIHVENGSWAGADNGDPEFKKWLGDPNGSGWSPDRNSWAVLTAAKNRVFTADDIACPHSRKTSSTTPAPTPRRPGITSCRPRQSDHWYWDGTEIWDSNVTRGSNLAVAYANQVISPSGHRPDAPHRLRAAARILQPRRIEFGAPPSPATSRSGPTPTM